MGYGVKIFLPSPPNYVTRSPGRYSYSLWTQTRFELRLRWIRKFGKNSRIHFTCANFFILSCPQEIDMVHSLTLGKIIRLNTGFKSAPDHVFFSSQYCEGVKDFQCVPRDNSAEENFHEKTTKQKHSCNRNSAVIAENNNNSCDALIPVLVATCGVFFFIAVVLFFICLKLWLHFRWHKAKDNALAGNQSQFELSYQNKNRIESAGSL